MFEYEYKGLSPSAGFFVLLGMLGAGLVIGGLIGLGVWMAMTGQGPLSFAHDMLNPAFTNAARTMQMVSAFFMFFIPALITARLMSRQPLRYLGYREGFTSRQLGLVIITILLCLPLVGALGELNKAIPIGKSLATFFQKMEDDYNTQVEALATMRSPAEFIFSLVVMALLPAVFEETLFRGALQQLLVAWFRRPLVAIVVTSIIFSAVHLSYYGFLPRFALGMVLGLIFYYSKSIWLNMAAHFINNAFAITLMYYFYTHGKPVKEAVDETGPVWMGLPALVAVIFLLLAIRKVSYKRLIYKIPPIDSPGVHSPLV